MLWWNSEGKKKTWNQAFQIPSCLVVPWLEPDARWKYPGGRGHRRLPGHLHLCALQRPGYHGHVPPCHFGAKGTWWLMLVCFSAFCSITSCAHDGLLFLQDPPYFNVRPGGEYRQEAGRELVIPCAASGDPDIPTITWRKVVAVQWLKPQSYESISALFLHFWTESLSYPGPLKVGKPSKSKHNILPSGSLQFVSLSKEDHGEWECVATNVVTSITASTRILVIGTQLFHTNLSMSLWGLCVPSFLCGWRELQEEGHHS